MSYSYVPEDIATLPASGESIVDNWWVVHPEKGLAFFQRTPRSDLAPQCNRNERVTNLIQPKLNPDCTVKHIPIVFMSSVAKYRRENGDE